MPKQKTKQKPCAHHWIIDPSNGPTSFGRCKHCGMVREFLNDWTKLYIKGDHPSDGDNTQRDN